MHLSYSSSSYKGQIYKSYSIAESLREGGKVRKRIVWPIGKLTDQQAEQIRSILAVIHGKDKALARLEDIVVEESRSYLDIAVVNHIWDQWGLNEAFNFCTTGGPLPTHAIARILTINRCTDPCSNYAVPIWAKKTALAEVLNIDLSGLNDDKIYYELDKIQKNQISIENHLSRRTYEKNPGAGLSLNPSKSRFYDSFDKLRFEHLLNLRNDTSRRAKELGIIEGKQIAIDYHCDPSDSRFPGDKSLSRSPDKNGDLVYAHRPQIIWDSVTNTVINIAYCEGRSGGPPPSTNSVRRTCFESSIPTPCQKYIPIQNTPGKSSLSISRFAVKLTSPCA